METALVREGHPNPQLTGEPACTRSQILIYKINGLPVAIVHQYLRRDGQIGGSGLPDPKRVVVVGDGTLTLRVREG